MVEPVGGIGISHVLVAHPDGRFAKKTLLLPLSSLQLLQFLLQGLVLALTQ